MKLNELAEKIEAKVVRPGRSNGIEITQIYAGDKMSDLLYEASDTTLLVTNLVNTQLARIAELMDVPGICLLNDTAPEPELVISADERGTAIIVSAAGMFETCGRLYQCLYGEDKPE